MSTDSDQLDQVDGQERDPTHGFRATCRDGHLSSVVVRYTDEPDQRTVFPTDTFGFELTTTWLTARADAFVDLADAR